MECRRFTCDMARLSLMYVGNCPKKMVFAMLTRNCFLNKPSLLKDGCTKSNARKPRSLIIDDGHSAKLAPCALHA